jgi:fructosamine-3-kinase
MQGVDARNSPQALADALARATGAGVDRMTAVHGGDTAAAFRFELTSGIVLFAKTHASPPAGFFTTEAWGLEWLRSSGAVRVPRVVAVSDGIGEGDVGGEPAFLALEWIDTTGRGAVDEVAFGRELALLHDAGAPCFGRADRRTTGSLALPNEPSATWSDFVANCRFTPLARIARERSALPLDTIDRLERLAGTLERFDDGSAPARLHGDLWAGNRIVDRDGGSWLIDPAAHGGHREFDLAMMRLFGGFGVEVFESYADVHPLPDGWLDRVELHQIAPLVVHAVKFGGGYVAAAARAVERYV